MIALDTLDPRHIGLEPSGERALIALGKLLLRGGYQFVTPTPGTHARVNARRDNAIAQTVEDALGWSRPFEIGTLPPAVFEGLQAAGVLESEGKLCRSTVRFSTCDDSIYVHSAYPTRDSDAVFFGPDTYRFVSLVRAHLRPCQRLVDVGAGSGAGGLSVRNRATRVVLSDINPAAVRTSAINTAITNAGNVTCQVGNLLGDIGGPIDAVIANPPYIVDGARRTYRDGGGELGIDLSLRVALQALCRLSSGGQFILYTGSPVVAGRHPLRDRLDEILAARPCHHTFTELDPDVFGEELSDPAYAGVDRIAVVAVIMEVL